MSLTLGPERPTFFERAVSSLHLPYLAGCLVFAALFGPPAQLLALFLDTRDLSIALYAMQLIANPSTPLTLESLAISQTLYFGLLVYAAYMIRYMRTKVVAAEPELESLSPEGEETLHRVFGRISHARPPLLLSVLLFALGINFLVGSLQLRTPTGQTLTGGATLIAGVAVNVENAVLFAVWIWVYYAALRGLHSLGKKPLRFKSFNEDTMLGVRPIGSLAFSLAAAFFGVLVLAAGGIVFFSDPVSLLSFGGFVALGVVMFFLPLRSLHERMRQERQRVLAALRVRLTSLLAPADNPGSDDASKALSRLTTVLTLQMARQDAASIPTWPFDTRILGRLSAIILSVIAIVLARVIGDVLL